LRFFAALGRQAVRNIEYRSEERRGKVFEQLKTNPMNHNLCVFERDVDCGIGYIGIEEKIIPSKL